MTALRRSLRGPWAAMLLAATLALRLLVPTGYMVDGHRGAAVLTVCPGMAAMPAHHHSDRHAPDQHDHGGGPCAFAGLSAAVIGAADPVAALAPAPAVRTNLADGRAPRLTPRPPRLRPPLRGPPTLA